MFAIPFCILFIILPTISCLSLFDVRVNNEILKYNGDQSSPPISQSVGSFQSSNSYYSSSNTSSSSLIDFMFTLYEREKLHQIPSNYNLIRALAPRIVQIDNGTMFVFDLNVIRRSETIDSVSLHFYKRRTRWPISYSLNEIYSSQRLSSLSAQIQLDSDSSGWQSFPIGDLIQRQINYLSSDPKLEYFGLTFKPTVNTKSRRRNLIDLDKFSVYTPFLIIYSNDSKQTNVFDEFIPNDFEEERKSDELVDTEVNQTNRFRRYVEDKSSPIETNLLSNNWNQSIPTNQPDKCGLKPLVVDFSDLGFSSWMIEPKSYMTNLCFGICQANSMTNHALIQYFLQRLAVRNDIEFGNACCVPERYSSLTIFYKSSQYNYLIRRVPNMIVDECHCR